MRLLQSACLFSLFPLFAAFPNAANAQADASKAKGDTTKSVVMEQRPARTDAAMEKWRDDRFGQMIHWGIYSVPGGFYNGKKIDYAAEWIKVAGKIPTDVYNDYVKQFDPKNYDPKQWASLFKAEGVKYVVITTKHHDGFCLWPSKYTKFSIASTPYKKDLLKPLADAVRAEGIDMGFYYSIIDWNNPDYRATVKNPDDEKAYQRYLTFMKAQLTELLTEFGDIKVLWFDGRWDPSYKNSPQIGKDLEAYLRKLKPGLVINSRVRAYDSIADYESGYERKLPTTAPKTDWESCMTIPPLTWGYHSDPGYMKSPREIVEMLVKCASMNGNFLLNLGPKPDGTIRSEETERMAAIGKWMAINGEGIYGTRSVDLTLPSGVYATKKGNRTYLQVFEWPKDGTLKVAGLGASHAALLSDPKNALPVTRGADGSLKITLPASAPDAIASTLVLETGTVQTSADPLDSALATITAYSPTGKPITDTSIVEARETLKRAVAEPEKLSATIRAHLDQLLAERKDRLIVTRTTPISENDPLLWVLVNYQSRLLQATPADKVTAYPGATDFPGTVPPNTPTVTKTLTIDATTDPAAWRSTGLYVAPGALVTVSTKTPLTGKGFEIRVGAHSDSIRNSSHHRYVRMPEISRVFPFESDTVSVANAFGGLIYVLVPKGANLGKIQVTISGAVEAPYYIAGKTTASEWKRLRENPAPWGELETKNIIFTIPSSDLRKLDDPASVARYWDKVVMDNAAFMGRPKGVLSFTSGGPSRTERYVPDVDISAGGMHAGYPIMTFLNAIPSELYPETEVGKRWGLLHELGHNYQTQITPEGRFRDWTTGGEGEVTNNWTPLYITSQQGIKWQVANPSLLKTQRQVAEMFARGEKPFQSPDLFSRLFMYQVLSEGIGWKPFQQVMTDYYRMPVDQRPKDDAEKRDQMMIRLSRLSGKNLAPFFTKWGYDTSATAQAAVAHLPRWEPPTPQ
jgi:alpha-L-fucosidase